ERQGPPKLAADLLQAILVILPEAIDRDFGIADLGKRGAAKAAKNIVDAPDGEATGEHRHDRCHKAAAEPIFGRFANTSEHAANVENARIGTARRRTIKEGSVPSQPMATSRKAPLFRPQLVWQRLVIVEGFRSYFMLYQLLNLMFSRKRDRQNHVLATSMA